jgi:inositol-pentakisphosphate 2-kinase
LTDLRPLFVERLLPLLYDTVLLRTLSTLQRTLDALDIEGLSALWSLNPSQDHQENIPVGWRSPEPTIEEWVSFTAEYLEGGRKYDSFDLDKMEVDRLRYWMLSYLMSATFKDCSMILRLHGGEKDGKDTITAIDLDPKSVERLRQWGKQDREIVLAYKAHGMTKQPCIDDGNSELAPHDNLSREFIVSWLTDSKAVSADSQPDPRSSFHSCSPPFSLF